MTRWVNDYQILDAIYENGIFRPLRPLGTPEGQQVRLEVESSLDEPPNDLLELAAQVYQGLPDKQIDGIEQISSNRRDFFIERSL